MRACELHVGKKGEQDTLYWVAKPVYFQLEGAFWKERGKGSEELAVPAKNVFNFVSIEEAA